MKRMIFNFCALVLRLIKYIFIFVVLRCVPIQMDCLCVYENIYRRPTHVLLKCTQETNRKWKTDKWEKLQINKIK